MANPSVPRRLAVFAQVALVAAAPGESAHGASPEPPPVAPVGRPPGGGAPGSPRLERRALPLVPTWLADRCRASRGELSRLAGALADGSVALGEPQALEAKLRDVGGSYVWPRGWVLSGPNLEPSDAGARLSAWLGTLPRTGARRCGVAYLEQGGRQIAAAVVVDAQADPESFPAQVRAGTYLRFGAKVLVAAQGAKVVAMGPDGPPRTVPTSFSSDRATAIVPLDHPGTWTLQLLLDGPDGPLPALESRIVAEASEGGRAPAPADDEDGLFDPPPPRDAPPPSTLLAMTNAARAREGLALLTPNRMLEILATEHAKRLRRLGRLAHDAGSGSPADRVRASGLDASRIGENVAHACDLRGVQRALWASPSHRMNLLDGAFNRFGGAAVTDADGTLWAVELFARLPK